MAESGMFPFSRPRPAMQVGGLGVENPVSNKIQMRKASFLGADHSLEYCAFKRKK